MSRRPNRTFPHTKTRNLRQDEIDQHVVETEGPESAPRRIGILANTENSSNADLLQEDYALEPDVDSGDDFRPTAYKRCQELPTDFVEPSPISGVTKRRTFLLSNKTA